jgi:hypothetical protein
MCGSKTDPARARGAGARAWNSSPVLAAALGRFARCLRGLGAPAGRDTAPQLVERLRARLGEEAVYGVCLIPEHRPEAAWRRVHELRLRPRLRRDGDRMRRKCRVPCGCCNEPAASADRTFCKVPNASRAAGGTAKAWHAITTSRAVSHGAHGCGFFRNGGPSAGICTACSLEAARFMYAELHALSNFSFLRGASHPEELVDRPSIGLSRAGADR